VSLVAVVDICVIDPEVSSPDLRTGIQRPALRSMSLKGNCPRLANDTRALAVADVQGGLRLVRRLIKFTSIRNPCCRTLPATCAMFGRRKYVLSTTSNKLVVKPAIRIGRTALYRATFTTKNRRG